MLTWNDFAVSGLGPFLPLTSGQKIQLPGRLLPSGEANFFDIYQSHSHSGVFSFVIGSVSGKITGGASGINFNFPSPPEFIPSGVGQSGLYRTYGPNLSLIVKDVSGIFHASGI
jgi:hypothetical protein